MLIGDFVMYKVGVWNAFYNKYSRYNLVFFEFIVGLDEFSNLNGYL